MTEDVLAGSWALYELANGSFVRGKGIDKQRQIASLTKMFTLAVCLELEKKYRLDERLTVRICEEFHVGTTANLQKGYYMSLQDLYHGMMLPSSNDASLVLATYFGWFLVKPPKPKSEWSDECTQCQCLDLSENREHYRLYLSKFLHEMNRLAKQLGLEGTSFDNPHGLANKYNISTVKDLVIAVREFLRNPGFRKIVNTKQYIGELKNQTGDTLKKLEWVNSNVLLKEGYYGAKTGYTTDAGGCLAAILNLKHAGYQQECLVIVLGSTDQQTRFSDVRAIVAAHRRYLDLINA